MASRPIAASATTSVITDEILAYYRRRCDDIAELAETKLRSALRNPGLQQVEPDERFWAMIFHRPDHQQAE
jgi:hypothetical protein